MTITLKDMQSMKNTDPYRDFLTTPFCLEIYDPKFYDRRHTMTIFVGKMGQGKTHAYTNSFLRTLIDLPNNEGPQLLMYSVPETSSFEHDKFEQACDHLSQTLGKTIKYVTTMERTGNLKSQLRKIEKQYLAKGYIVVYSMTNAAITSDATRDFVNRLMVDDIKISVMVDESHTWLCSCQENYNLVTGNSGTRSYEAKLFEFCAHIAKKSPFVFGMTATANREQRGEIRPAEGLSFKIANKMCPKKNLLTRNGWISSFNLYDVKHTGLILKEFVKHHQNSIEESNTKKCAMISCAARIDTPRSNPWTLEVMHEQLRQDLIQYANYDMDDHVIAILNKDGCKTFTLNGDGERITEDELKERMKDPTDPLHYLLVVYKGVCGTDISSLSHYMSVHAKNKKTSDQVHITVGNIQRLGRFVRANLNSDIYDGYTLEQYINKYHTNEEMMEQLIIDNSFHAWMPDTDTNHVVKQLFEDEYANSVEDAREYIRQLPVVR